MITDRIIKFARWQHPAMDHGMIFFMRLVIVNIEILYWLEK